VRWVALVAAAVFFAGIVGAIVAAERQPSLTTPTIPVPATKTVAK
jgi:hypothetical protein